MTTDKKETAAEAPPPPVNPKKTIPIPAGLLDDYTGPTKTVAVRMPYEHYQRLRRYFWALERSLALTHPMLHMSLADATRDVIRRGLLDVERQFAAEGRDFPDTGSDQDL